MVDKTKVVVMKGNTLGIVPSDNYRVNPPVGVQVVSISNDGVLATGWAEPVDHPIRQGTFSSENFEILVHKESEGRLSYSLVIKDNQVVKVTKNEGILPAPKEQLDILEIALDYIEKPEHVWDTSKYVGDSKRTGKIAGRPSSITLMYVRGTGFIKGLIDETSFEITFCRLQGYQLSIGNPSIYRGTTTRYSQDRRKEMIERIVSFNR